MGPNWYDGTWAADTCASSPGPLLLRQVPSWCSRKRKNSSFGKRELPWIFWGFSRGDTTQISGPRSHHRWCPIKKSVCSSVFPLKFTFLKLTVRTWKLAISKGNYRIPTIRFQVRTVIFREVNTSPLKFLTFPSPQVLIDEFCEGTRDFAIIHIFFSGKLVYSRVVVFERGYVIEHLLFSCCFLTVLSNKMQREYPPGN